MGKCKFQPISWNAFGFQGTFCPKDGVEMFFNVKECVGSKPAAGDIVKFDIGDSDRNPGQKQAVNVTGGSQPLDTPQGGGFGPMWGPDWGWGGGKGMWDGGKGFGGCGGWGGPPMKGGLKGGMMMANGPYGGKGFGKW